MPPAAWPSQIVIDNDIVRALLTLQRRAISIDPEDEECQDPQQQLAETEPSLIGRNTDSDGEVVWTRCSLREAVSAAQPSTPLAVDEVLSLLQTSQRVAVYIQRGKTFRPYAVEIGSLAPAMGHAPPPTQVEPAAPQSSSAPAASSPDRSDSGGDSSSATRGRRNREKYCRAIAFEFVSSVMETLIPDEDARNGLLEDIR